MQHKAKPRPHRRQGRTGNSEAFVGPLPAGAGHESGPGKSAAGPRAKLPRPKCKHEGPVARPSGPDTHRAHEGHPAIGKGLRLSGVVSGCSTASCVAKLAGTTKVYLPPMARPWYPLWQSRGKPHKGLVSLSRRRDYGVLAVDGKTVVSALAVARKAP